MREGWGRILKKVLPRDGGRGAGGGVSERDENRECDNVFLKSKRLFQEHCQTLLSKQFLDIL